MSHRARRLALTCIASLAIASSLRAQAQASNERAKPFDGLSRALLAGRDSLVQLTKRQVGLKYRRGALQPGKAFDCSSLVQWVASLFGSILPRTAAEQAHAGIEVPKDTAQLLPGDLLIFGRGPRVTHIGIYVGEGKYVHAANPRKGVIESDLSRARPRYWKSARRIFVDVDSVFRITPQEQLIPKG